MPDSERTTTDPDFQIWPVLDLMGGNVVRGVAGKRAEYRPLTQEADPIRVVAKLFADYESAFREFYIADLDGLQGQETQSDAIRELVVEFPQTHFWIDAGFGSVAQVERFFEGFDNAMLGQVSLILATEALESWSCVDSIVEASSARLAFSLDLINGVVRAKTDAIACMTPETIIERAVSIGIHDVIVLDVASVGVRKGVSTLALCRRILERFPAIRLVTGGGVRTIEDLASIQRAGCHSALVATSLHDRSINATELNAFCQNRAG